MTGLFKVCGAALLSVVAILFIGKTNKDSAFALRVGGGVLIFGILLSMIGEYVELIRASLSGISGIVSRELSSEREIMLKALGIATLIRLTTDICKDAGEGGLAVGVEGVGRLTIVGLCLPLAAEIFEVIVDLLESL